MQTNIFSIIIGLICIAITGIVMLYLLYLIIKVMRVYIKSNEVRKEKKQTAKSLGEVLKRHRTECKMTQEFVAETICVSRQAVSKWESGLSDPNTSNLVALAKLYGISPEDLLRETRE